MLTISDRNLIDCTDEERRKCIPTIERMVYLAQSTRLHGLLSLEDEVEGDGDKFLKYVIMLIVDANKPERVYSSAMTLMTTTGCTGYELLRQYIILDGALMIQEGINPRTVRDSLLNYLGLALKNELNADLEATALPDIERVKRDCRLLAEALTKEDYVKLTDSLNENELACLVMFLRPSEAACVLGEIPPETREVTLKRIIDSPNTDMAMLSKIKEWLRTRIPLDSGVTKVYELDAAQTISEILRNGSSDLRKEVSGQLQKINPQFADAVERGVILFDDILRLEAKDVHEIFRNVDFKDLTVALKGSSEAVRDKVLSSMPKNMAEDLINDIEYLHNVRMRDVQEAQARIASVIRKLEEEGEIRIF